MFYDSNGNLLTPGNLTSTGGIIRKKPDLTAADGVSTSVTGFSPFYGTSAAAPHAAAIAALLKSANPAATPAQIRAALVGSALRVAVSGPDNATGAGIVMGPAALRLILNVAAAKTDAPPVLTLRSSAGVLNLQASGLSGARYQVESSPDLATWSSGPIVTNPPLGSIDLEEPITNRRSFYRLRQITPP
jgi:subtilisin family serine protease